MPHWSKLSVCQRRLGVGSVCRCSRRCLSVGLSSQPHLPAQHSAFWWVCRSPQWACNRPQPLIYSLPSPMIDQSPMFAHKLIQKFIPYLTCMLILESTYSQTLSIIWQYIKHKIPVATGIEKVPDYATCGMGLWIRDECGKQAGTEKTISLDISATGSVY